MDIVADILPAEGLGGFCLGKKISEYSNILEMYNILDKLKYEQANIYSTRYSFVDIPIEINVDTRTGSIYKISALEGYLGMLGQSIKIGSSAQDVLNLRQEYYYDECDEAIYSKTVQGVSIELNADDPLPNEINDLKVKYISVFQPEIFKP